MADVESYQVQMLDAEALYPLRSQVLRPGLPLSTCAFDGDNDAGTRHFALTADAELLVIASTYQRSRRPDAGATVAPLAPAWQLRGMATATAAQGRGLGAALLSAVLQAAAANAQTEVWCNAREEALGFYLRHGFETISARFIIDGVGPHYIMRCLPAPG